MPDCAQILYASIFYQYLQVYDPHIDGTPHIDGSGLADDKKSDA